MKKFFIILAISVLALGSFAQNALTVGTPNGGETWQMGCPNIIQWTTASTTTGGIRIELFRNDVFMLVIAQNLPAGMNSFTWMVPWALAPGNNYKVKVISVSNPAVFDFSNAPFSIASGSITVLSPNGGETWVKGTAHPIHWNDNLCDNVRIELWKGGVLHSVIAPNVPSTGMFSWLIPTISSLVPGNDYRIRIQSAAANAATTLPVFDFSDSLFSIAAGTNNGQITVVTPNGGENWVTGCPSPIRWVTTSAANSPVKIELFRNDSLFMLISPNVPGNLSNFTWMVPLNLIPGGGYKVKVTSLSNPGVFDFSNNPFSISRGLITIIAPNGGETWVKGTMHPILWNDNICDNVRIELWKAGNLHSVIAPSVPSTGNFQWMIPNINTLVPGSDYKVRILRLAGNAITTILAEDFSDSVFSILPGSNPGQIAVVTPNGGENWLMGCPGLIQWTTTATTIGPVKIDLFRNGQFSLTICPQVPAGQTTFTWIVPWQIVAGDNYKVRVSSLSNPAISDFSDNNFSIAAGNLTVISPNGGETWVKGTMHPITWTDNLCDNVRIELWQGNLFKMVIASSVPSNGIFNWMIPLSNILLPGNGYRIRILGQMPATTPNSGVFDYSDSTFTILASPSPDQPVLSLERNYPNPCTREWNLTFSGHAESTVILKVYTLTGNEVWRQELELSGDNPAVRLNVSDLPEGNYIFTLGDNSGMLARGLLRVGAR